MSAGKGDKPRNLGPKFRKNYELIDWGKTKSIKTQPKENNVENQIKQP